MNQSKQHIQGAVSEDGTVIMTSILDVRRLDSSPLTATQPQILWMKTSVQLQLQPFKQKSQWSSK